MGTQKKELVNLIICIGLGIFLYFFISKPAVLTFQAWRLFAIFLATILGIIIKPLPMGAVAILGLTMSVVTKTIDLQAAFDGFGSPIVWLVIFAFFIARGFIETGFGQRIGLICIRFFGRRTLGLSYGIVLTDLIIAPAVPSVAARAAGIIYPIVQGIARSYDSYPETPSAKKIGAYLTLTCFQGTVITSAMFMTAMAANPLLVELTGNLGGLELTWVRWALAASVPGLMSLLVMPWVVYQLAPPEITETPDAIQIAHDKLLELGRMSRSEWVMAGVTISLVTLWVLGSVLSLPAVVTALLGLSVLLVFRVLDWNVLLQEKNAWETFVWFSIVLMMAKYLTQYGVMAWFSEACISIVGTQMAWFWSAGFLGLVYFYSHYLFASSTAHISSMYASFLGVLILLGAPPMLSVLCLIFASNLFGGLTHYSFAPAPLLYGVGYVPLKTWWRVGFVMSVINILIWGGLGSLWWKWLGYW